MRIKQSLVLYTELILSQCASEAGQVVQSDIELVPNYCQGRHWYHLGLRRSIIEAVHWSVSRGPCRQFPLQGTCGWYCSFGWTELNWIKLNWILSEVVRLEMMFSVLSLRNLSVLSVLSGDFNIILDPDRLRRSKCHVEATHDRGWSPPLLPSAPGSACGSRWALRSVPLPA